MRVPLIWSRRPFAAPVKQQCEVLSCSYAFRSEVLSQMRSLRLQLLITAGQHSRQWGESQEKKSTQLVKQNTRCWTPRPPRDRCACVDLFIYFLYAADSYAWLCLRGKNLNWQAHILSVSRSLQSLRLAAFWLWHLRWLKIPFENMNCAVNYPNTSSAPTSKCLEQYICSHDWKWEYSTAVRQLTLSLTFTVSIVKINRWRWTELLDHLRKQTKLMWAFFHLSVGISPVCLLNTCVLVCQPWWATCWPTSMLTSHTPPPLPQPRHPPLTDSLRLTLG